MIDSRKIGLLPKVLVLMTIVAVSVLTIGTYPVSAGAESKATVCHKPGTPAERTLVVAEAAVEAHTAHGDSVGECGGSAPLGSPMCQRLNAGEGNMSFAPPGTQLDLGWDTVENGFIAGELITWEVSLTGPGQVYPTAWYVTSTGFGTIADGRVPYQNGDVGSWVTDQTASGASGWLAFQVNYTGWEGPTGSLTITCVVAE